MDQRISFRIFFEVSDSFLWKMVFPRNFREKFYFFIQYFVTEKIFLRNFWECVVISFVITFLCVFFLNSSFGTFPKKIFTFRRIYAFLFALSFVLSFFVYFLILRRSDHVVKADCVSGRFPHRFRSNNRSWKRKEEKKKEKQKETEEKWKYE